MAGSRNKGAQGLNQSASQGRWQQLGPVGAWTLLLSTLLVVGSAGLSWLLMFWHARQVAVRTPTSVPVHGWILVLGKRLLGATVTCEFAERLRRAETLYRAADKADIMVMGGHTAEGPFSEAEQGRNFLLQRGLPADRLHCEDISHHTLENLQRGRHLLGAHAQQPLVMVTSRSHMARSLAMARGMGLPVVPCAAEEAWQWSLRAFWRLGVESLMLHWYWVGRLWSTLTRNQKSLARIS